MIDTILFIGLLIVAIPIGLAALVLALHILFAVLTAPLGIVGLFVISGAYSAYVRKRMAISGLYATPVGAACGYVLGVVYGGLQNGWSWELVTYPFSAWLPLLLVVAAMFVAFGSEAWDVLWRHMRERGARNSIETQQAANDAIRKSHGPRPVKCFYLPIPSPPNKNYLRDYVRAVALCPDAKYALCIDWEDRLCVFDVSRGLLVARRKAKPAFALFADDTSCLDRAIHFSPDGRGLLIGVGDRLDLWSAKSWRHLRFIGPVELDRAAAAFHFLPDGRHVLALYFNKALVLDSNAAYRYVRPAGKSWISTIWDEIRDADRRSNEQRMESLIREFKYDYDEMPKRNLFLVSEGSQYVFRPKDNRNTVIFADVRDAAVHRTVQLSAEIDALLAVNAQGTLAIGQRTVFHREDKEETIQTFDLATGRELWRLEGQDANVESIEFCPDGKRVLIAVNDNTIRLVNAETGKELRRFLGHVNRTSCLAVSPDGRYFLSGGDENVLRLWSLDD